MGFAFGTIDRWDDSPQAVEIDVQRVENRTISHSRERVMARVYASDMALAMSIMIALQLFGLLALLQLIHSLG